MHPLAHHAGEDSLLNLAVFAGTWLTVAAALVRARLAGAHARLKRKRREIRRRARTLRRQPPHQIRR